MAPPFGSLKPRILLAPLDWGLGHATRSIPIIRELIRQNAEVVLACSGKIKNLLTTEFPVCQTVELDGYDIRYSRNRWTLPFAMAGQIPRIFSSIKNENEKLQAIVQELGIEGIISDSRFGLYHQSLPSVFISHQLLIKSGMGKLADEWLQSFNYGYINRFNACWVPDLESGQSLAGELSHPSKKPAVPLIYLGPVSRFNRLDAEEKHLLVLLSGPEPQRTIFEEILLQELQNYQDKVVMVRGLPGDVNNPTLPANIEIFDHLPSDQLNKKMMEATLVIARCGYSTVMDLAALGKKSILVPTPGQTEQEYLAKHLMKQNFALCIDQDKFRLKPALALSENFPYETMAVSNNNIESAVSDFLATVKKWNRDKAGK